MTALDSVLLLSLLAADPLAAGDHNRKLTVDDREGTYLIHIPTNYDHDQPTPVVLILHGAATNATITVSLTGMSQKSDEAGFIAVYPNGTGLGPLLTWNAGGRKGKLPEESADDVKYVGLLLDDLAKVANIDSQRVYATGMSNGGMMCYRLAAEMSDRTAAIAPVAGTVTTDESKPKRPVPVMHFHGKADDIVPYDGLGNNAPKFLPFKSVEESIAIWCQINQCPDQPTTTEFPDKELPHSFRHFVRAGASVASTTSICPTKRKRS
jgi:polyhydroxybutyrate depolymerase